MYEVDLSSEHFDNIPYEKTWITWLIENVDFFLLYDWLTVVAYFQQLSDQTVH